MARSHADPSPDSARTTADSRPPLDRMVVLQGEGATIDERTLAGYCQDAEAELGLPVEVIRCATTEEFTTRLREQLARRSGVVADPGSLTRAPDLTAALATDHAAVMWVSLHRDRSGRWGTANLAPRCIVGRGVDGYRFGLQAVAARCAWPYAIHHYGTEAEQFGQLRLPRDRNQAHPVVALFHGGGWRDSWSLDVTERVAVDLARRGYATWNLEFRRVGATPWPVWHTLLDDVAAGIDHLKMLASHEPLDLKRFAVVGHSSGGHLALWAAIRHRLPPEAPGAQPDVVPALAIALAGLGELEEFALRGLDSGSAAALVGGLPEDVPERYAVASPVHHVGGDIPQLVVNGEAEEFSDLNDLARAYERAVRAAGGDVQLVELPRTRHLDFLDPVSPAWRWTARQLADRLSL